MDPKAEYTFHEPCRQNFGLPYGMMTFISQKNANPVAYSKLISTCKHFFAKRPLLIVEDLWRLPRTPYQYRLTYENKSILLEEEALEATKLKLWITDELETFKGFFANLLKKLYRFDGDQLILSYGELTLEEYLILTSSKNLIKRSIHL